MISRPMAIRVAERRRIWRTRAPVGAPPWRRFSRAGGIAMPTMKRNAGRTTSTKVSPEVPGGM
jgi:hypothetical protein